MGRNFTRIRRPIDCHLVFCGLIAIGIGMSAGFVVAGPPAKRARPPKFSKAVTDVFFPDARQKLVGTRPDKPTTAAAAPDSTPASPPTRPAASSLAWEPLISAEAIEDEIKAQHQALRGALQNAVQFKGGDYRKARRHLSILAAMFAINADYAQPMRWHRVAPAVRDAVARAGFNCKVGSDASYKEAKTRYDDLETLIRGGSIDVGQAENSFTWPRVADRSTLMTRLEAAQEERLAAWTANAGAFDENLASVAHEAQIIAALAEVIAREGYEYADDETYQEYAGTMRDQALKVREAVAASDYSAARQAVGEIGKACAQCHEGFRN